eukprot:1267937-Pyramimonas_sp.AAC.1
MRNLLMPPARELAWFASLFHQEAPRCFVHCQASLLYDESRHCLGCLKPGTGAKDAPRAFAL